MPFTYVSIRESDEIDLTHSNNTLTIGCEDICIFLHDSQVEKIVKWAEERKAVQYDFLSAHNINVISGLKK